MRFMRRFSTEYMGLATIEYVIGAAVILGTLVIGVSAWNNGLATRLQALVTQLQTVR
jgi:Flp pilus assembly pilin Flp